MVYGEIFKNQNGTRTGVYSGESGPRTMAYNFMITTGHIVYSKDYTVQVIGVTKNSIKTRYVYDDGQVWDHSFTPHAFYYTFLYDGYCKYQGVKQ